MPLRLDLKLPRNNSLIASMLPCLVAPSRPAASRGRPPLRIVILTLSAVEGEESPHFVRAAKLNPIGKTDLTESIYFFFTGIR
jgi:hypothetical protein